MEFGRCAADIAIASRRRENVESAGGEIRRETGRRCLSEVCDIRDAERVEEVVGCVARDYGRIDIVVNNAGGQFPGPAETITVKGWNAVINNNPSGFWFVAQAMANRMIPRRSGSIIAITANYRGGMPGLVHSSAARAAVRNMLRTVSVEWGRFGTRINAGAPGTIDTKGLRKTDDPRALERLRSEQPPGYWGTPEKDDPRNGAVMSGRRQWTNGADA